MLDSEKRKDVINNFRLHEVDTGSPEVQIALLSSRIEYLTEHFKAHKKDHHSRRGLLQMVQRRKSLLGYLRGRSPERYKTLITSLGIRH